MDYSNGNNSILLHPYRPAWAVLNNTAYAVSQKLLQEIAPEKIAADIGIEYGLKRDEALQDILQVQEALNHLGFLDIANCPARKRTPRLRSVFLHLTHHCNLSCPHCYVSKPKSQTPAYISLEQLHAIFTQVKDLGGQTVTLSGGEPLLHPEINGIIHHAARKLEVRLLTNGTLLDRGRAALLAQKGVRVQVSIDGPTPEIHDAIRGKGSFKGAIRALKLLQEAGLGDRINMATTVMRTNIGTLSQTIELAEQMGLPLVRFLPLRKRGNAVNRWREIGEGLTREDAEGFYDSVIHSGLCRGSGIEVSCGLSGFMLKMPAEAADDVWCPLGRQLVVDVDGSAYPCAAMMHPEFRIGNVFADPLEVLLHSDVMVKLCEALTERRRRIHRCMSCNWRNLCQSGCMALALEHKGTIWDTDDFCEYRQKLYTEAFDRILSLQEKANRRNV